MKKLAVLISIFVLFVVFIWWRYAETERFPDLTSSPLWTEDRLELVAELPMPPGNIAVAPDGRIFITFHPDAGPEFNVVELVDGEVRPFPGRSWQPGGPEPKAFQQVLSLRVDQQNRLWTLDAGTHGVGQPRLLAFDLDTGALVHEFDFGSETFGVGSHANDFQVSPDGLYVFISDASIFAQTPALVVYSVEKQSARRILESDISVRAGQYEPVVQGRPMTIAGIFTINPGVDGIALSRDGETLFYASVSGDMLYKIPTRHLKYAQANDRVLAGFVEPVGRKTMTDGMTTDQNDNVYLTDIEHSAVVRMNSNGERVTLLKTDKLRWPDGFSFGPQGYLYITCSALHDVLGKFPDNVRKMAPYPVYRVKTNQQAVAGH
ncbi:L-dopachrome tautomerase-related protein [Litoribacillus peritrichatus]|uniref:L-dopachrome tautomerase-related protein n=1 Tax=Litoribacillus peritrichatus TaxID=718191 RepID=A0ABP7N0U2_9GAMM